MHFPRVPLHPHTLIPNNDTTANSPIVLCKSLQRVFISLKFISSKEPDLFVIFKVLLGNSFPDFLKVFECFSLDTSFSVIVLFSFVNL